MNNRMEVFEKNLVSCVAIGATFMRIRKHIVNE